MHHERVAPLRQPRSAGISASTLFRRAPASSGIGALFRSRTRRPAPSALASRQLSLPNHNIPAKMIRPPGATPESRGVHYPIPGYHRAFCVECRRHRHDVSPLAVRRGPRSAPPHPLPHCRLSYFHPRRAPRRPPAPPLAPVPSPGSRVSVSTSSTRLSIQRQRPSRLARIGVVKRAKAWAFTVATAATGRPVAGPQVRPPPPTGPDPLLPCDVNAALRNWSFAR